MEENDFIDCGQYAGSLSEIAQEILKQRIINGEKITNKDIQETKSNIFEAYQVILSNASFAEIDRGAVISRSISSLTKLIENKGDLSNIKEMADVISQEQVLEEQKNNSIRSQNSGLATAVVIGGTVAVVSKDFALNKIFDLKLQQKVNFKYKEAQSGDTEATKMANVMDKIANLPDTNNDFSPEQHRELLFKMMRLSAINDEISNETLSKLADNYNMDCFTTDGQGNSIFDAQKLQEEFQQAWSEVNPEIANMTISKFAEYNEKVAKREIDRGTYMQDGLTFKDSAENYNRKVQALQFEREINRLLRSKDSDGIKKMVESKPEVAKLVLKNLNAKTQTRDITPEKIDKINNKISTIGQVLTEINNSKPKETVDFVER